MKSDESCNESHFHEDFYIQVFVVNFKKDVDSMRAVFDFYCFVLRNVSNI